MLYDVKTTLKTIANLRELEMTDDKYQKFIDTIENALLKERNITESNALHHIAEINALKEILNALQRINIVTISLDTHYD